ncbi:MAG: basic amino acid ABC transporter substrate-binding protein [Oscillospiraceae bacterium]|nr:basic amino acid ABC transporter substrate-binding protein [Oscillospiraceae bacterium]
MNKIFRLISLAAAAALCAGALAGCGKSDSQIAENGGTINSDTLIMGTNAEFPPFEFVSNSGVVDKFAGIDVEIAKKIADKAGKELKITDMQFDGLIAAVSTKKVDMAVAGMTADDERRESVDFSDTYYVAEQVIIVAPNDDSIKSAEDLKNNKKVGVVLGYTADSIITKDLKIDDKNIRRASRALDIVQDVKNGKLDAVVVDSYTGKALAEKNGLKVIEDPEAFAEEEYAIAVRKGNKELLDLINETLKEMKENGEIEELSQKYSETEE